MSRRLFKKESTAFVIVILGLILSFVNNHDFSKWPPWVTIIALVMVVIAWIRKEIDR